MALDPLRLPPLLTQSPITDPRTGTPTQFFLDYINDLTRRFVTAVNAVNSAVSSLQIANQATVASQQSVVAVAQTSAQAQASADAGGPAQSGDARLVLANVVNAWAAGPQVNLAGVVAGSLSIVNSGPVQTSNTNVQIPGDYVCSWRVVQIVGAVETVVFTGQFGATCSADDVGRFSFIFNQSDTTALIAAASVGAVSYRLDVISPDVGIQNLELYLYVRRA